MDTTATRTRVRRLRRYVTENLLTDGDFICPHYAAASPHVISTTTWLPDSWGLVWRRRCFPRGPDRDCRGPVPSDCAACAASLSRHTVDDYPAVLGEIATARVAGHERTAARLIRKIRFEPPVHQLQKPPRPLKAAVYARDHYHCRYCGRKVNLTPVMRLLSRLYPDDFPYHPSWRIDATHPAFTSASATLDHVVPVSHGGHPVDPDNLVTACWTCNRRKGDLSLDELGWSLTDPHDPTWTGLADLFEPLWEAAERPKLGTAEMWWLKHTRSISQQQTSRDSSAQQHASRGSSALTTAGSET